MRRVAAMVWLCCVPAVLSAQPPDERFIAGLVARADSLLAGGAVFHAESLYYDAARLAPRNAVARLALGTYLAQRGAWRVGAVLMEEARDFGGDPREIARRLAPLYARLYDFSALAMLPASPLPLVERERALWLTDNAPTAAGPDSVSVAFTPDMQGPLGTIRVRIGTDTLQMRIDPAVSGLVLDTSWLRRSGVRVFLTGDTQGMSSALGAVLALDVGSLHLTSVPARFAPLTEGRLPQIGLDVLDHFAARFSASEGTLTLWRGRPRYPGSRPLDAIPVVLRPNGLFLAPQGGLAAMTGAAGRALLRGPAWTLDWRRGEVVVER